MNIRPRNIIKLQGGNTLDWYAGLSVFDPKYYESTYNPNYLFAGDTSKGLMNAWKSNISGYDVGRYQPTSGYGAFGKNKAHFNYTKSVEEQPYYIDFGKALLTEDKKDFSPIGKQWAEAVDKLLPYNSKASFYNPLTGKLRTSWITQYKDAHGEPAKTFTNLSDYVEHVRNDKILGARHNVFGKTGRRYFYKDKNGLEHWVNPKEIDKYIVSDSPVRETQDGTTMWEDYE